MHSEYDFLSTYSRRLRRTAILLMGAGAVLAGAFSMALTIALPLQPRSNVEMERATTASPAKSSPAAAPSQKAAQTTDHRAAKTTTGNVDTHNSAKPVAAAGLAEKGAANPGTAEAPTPTLPKAPLAGSTAAQPAAARAASIRHKPPNMTKNAMIKTNESTSLTEREDGSATTPALGMTVGTSPDSSVNLADHRRRKKQAYKRKPQKTRFARPDEDLRRDRFADQSAFAWPLLSFTTNPQSRVHPP